MALSFNEETGTSSRNYPIILEDTFFVVSKQTVIENVVTLQNKRLIIEPKLVLPNGKKKVEYVNVGDITGCHVCERLENSRLKKIPSCRPNSQKESRRTSSVDPAVYLRVFSYPVKKRLKVLARNHRRERKTFSFKVWKSDDQDVNLDLALKWRTAILWVSRGVTIIPPSPPTPRRLLVLVNPFSGPGKALEIFQNQMVSLLEESDTLYHLLITDRANCARDFVREKDLTEWDGIVVVSGDGLMFEVFNGIMEREDWEQAIKTPLSIIPGGSGNGLAVAVNYALGEQFDSNLVLSSTLNVIRGRLSPMDLVKVETPTTPIYSFLSIGWGIISDIDIESERLRVLGGARFTLWALVRTIGLRQYPGRLSYLPVKGYTAPVKKVQRTSWARLKRSQTTLTESTNSTNVQCMSIRSSSLHSSSFDQTDRAEDYEIAFDANDVLDIENLDFGVQPKLQIDVPISDPTLENKDGLESGCNPTSLPPLDSPVPKDWTTIEGDFILVYSAHQTHLSSDCLFAPDAKLDDGIMWLVIIRAGVSRAQVVQFLLSLESGSHVRIPFVDVIPVTAFRLEPLTKDGYLTVDGEVINCTPIQAQVMPSVARIMTK